jgi:hypothetical protein
MFGGCVNKHHRGIRGVSTQAKLLVLATPQPLSTQDTLTCIGPVTGGVPGHLAIRAYWTTAVVIQVRHSTAVNAPLTHDPSAPDYKKAQRFIE